LQLIELDIQHMDDYLVVCGDEILNCSTSLDDGMSALKGMSGEEFPVIYTRLSTDQFLTEFTDLYDEHRTDVVGIVRSFQQGILPEDWKTWREHRYIKATIGGIEVEYDTCTTTFSYWDEEEDNWVVVPDCLYSD